MYDLLQGRTLKFKFLLFYVCNDIPLTEYEKKQAELKEKTDQEKQARIKAESESALISKLNQKINTQGYLDLNKDNLQMLGFLWMYVSAILKGNQNNCIIIYQKY